MLINQLEYQLKYQNFLMRPFVYPQIIINHVIIFFLLIKISKRLLISILLVLVYVSIFYHYRQTSTIYISLIECK